MSIRHIGAGLLLIASFSIGLYVSYRYKKRATGLKILYELLLHLQNEILHSRTQLPKCFLSFQKFSSEKQRTNFISGNFKEALAELELEKAVAVEYLSFFEQLGSREFEEEKERITVVVNKTKTILEESEKETAGKQRVASTLGFFIGALLFLLLF